MNAKTIFYLLTTIFCLSYPNVYAQYGKIACSDCNDEDLADVRRGLAKQNKVDTLRSYHLLASYFYSKEKLDSAKHYLNIVQQIDSSFISKKYAIFSEAKKHTKNFKYFLFEADESFSNAYINNEIVEEFLRSAEEQEELDDFSTELDKLDQQYRTNWVNALNEKKKILEDFKRTDTNFIQVQNLEDSLTFLQLVNDSLAVNFVLKKFDATPAYFKTNFNIHINAFFLHSVKRIYEIKPLLNYMLANENISIGNYSIYIDRYYCTKYDKAAFDSIHCEKDELLQHLAAIEFPVFYKAYLAERNEIKN